MDFTYFTKKRPGCKKCPAFKYTFVPPEIREDAKILAIGDSPWKTEVEEGQVFAGRAGDQLNEMLGEAKLSREETSLCNTAWCKMPADTNGKPTKPNAKIVKCCTEQFVFPLIHKLKPTIIVPMGDVALRGIAKKTGITKSHGSLFYHQIPGPTKDAKPYTVKILPIYHPAAPLYAPQLEAAIVQDLKHVKEQMDDAKIINTSKTVHYTSFKNKKDVLKFIRRARNLKTPHHAHRISIDTESTSLDWRSSELLSVQISYRVRYGKALHFMEPWSKKGKGRKAKITPGKLIAWAFDKEIVQAIYDLIHSGITIVGSHLKHDFRELNKLFRRVLNKEIDITKVKWRELLLEQMLLDETVEKGLKIQAHRLTDIRYPREELEVVESGNLKFASLKKRTMYGVRDVDAGVRVDQVLVKQLKQENDGEFWRLLNEFEMPSNVDSFLMENFGIHVSANRLNKLNRYFRRRMKVMKRQMFTIAKEKFNPGSTDQLREILFTKLKIKPGTDKAFQTKTGKIKCDKTHIEWLMENRDHPILEPYRLWKQYRTLRRTFIQVLLNERDENDLVHSNIKVHGTVTGRPSSEKPNILNMPRDREIAKGELISIRSVFTARPNHVIIAADSSQIELKCIALWTGLTRVLKKLAKGADYHSITAHDMYGKRFRKAERLLTKSKKWATRFDTMRTNAKTGNFAVVYQAGFAKLAKSMGVSEEKAEQFMDDYFEKYPEIKQAILEAEQQAVRRGYVVIPVGRHRRFPKTSDSKLQKRYGRQGWNAIAQGAAAYVIRAAITRIRKRFLKEGVKGFLTLTVYDSVVAEIFNDKKNINTALRIMCEELIRKVPWMDNFSFSIKIGVGDDLAEAEKVSVKVITEKDIPKWNLQAA